MPDDSLRLRDRLSAAWESYQASAGLPIADRLAGAKTAFRHAHEEGRHATFTRESDESWRKFMQETDKANERAMVAYRWDRVNSQREGRLNQARDAESYAKLDEHAKVIWQNWVNKETPSRAAGLAQTPTIRHVNKIGM
jgi:hypothetical protein